jgi:uncharacterized protein (TIGR03437 family)
VTPAGALTTIDAPFDRPADVKADSFGNVYVSDMLNHRVRRISPAGTTTTVAGDGVPVRGPDGVTATTSSLNLPTGLAIDAKGDVLVVDWGNALLRRITFSGAPVMRTGAIVNGASFTAPLAPGALFSMFGANLQGATVTVNGDPAPAVFTSPSQVNAQAPYSATGEARVEVVTSVGRSPAEFVPVADAAIGVFTFAPSRRAIALNQDNSINSPEAAEARGRVLTVFLTGIGNVSPALPTGEAAPFSTLHHANAAATATLGGVEAQVLFLGLTPGFIGLAQANVLIPEAAPTGAEVPLLIRSGTQTSNATVVSIR